MLPRTPRSTPFPTRRSSDLKDQLALAKFKKLAAEYPSSPEALEAVATARLIYVDKDRKSTRLNSSHTVISYAVFCLKKKIRRRHSAMLAKNGDENDSPLTAD